MRSCQHMLDLRYAPEVALRRSPLHGLVMQLSLFVSVFRPDALRAHM